MTDCLFCKMVRGEIRPDIVHEDDDVLAFRDINPQAPVHILVVPKRHVSTLDELGAGDAELVGRMTLVAAAIARDAGFVARGYRTVMNCNQDGGQTVFHIHLHLLAGRALHWPPG